MEGIGKIIWTVHLHVRPRHYLSVNYILNYTIPPNYSFTFFFRKHGCVTLAKHDIEYFNNAVEYLKKYNAPFTILSNNTLKEQFPHLTFSDDYKALLDIDGGIILANKGLAAFQVKRKERVN